MRRSRSALLRSSNFSTFNFSTLVLSTLIFFLLIGPMAQAQDGRPVLITQNVDESKLVTLAGNTRPEANKQNDRGLVADNLSMEHMLLQLRRSSEQERELEKFIDELHESSSPNFHQWITAKEFGERFGLAAQDLAVITRWLESHGFKVNVVYENGLLIDFSGTAGQVRDAFHTEIHNLNVKGVKHIANMSDPRIPAALAPAVVGVVSLHDFKPHTMYQPRSNFTFSGCGLECYAVVPGDLATIYNLNPLFNAGISGQGQTIVVVEDTDVFTTADWTTFRSVFGLSPFADGSFTQVHPAPGSGTNNCTDPGTNSDDGEAILDAEYASAAAPSATIELASCSNTVTFGGLIAIQNLLSEAGTPPAIMSMSYGECEAFNGASSNMAFSSAFQQAVTAGVSVFVSAGDDAASGCDRDAIEATHGIGITGWGSSPYNVSVGGTDFGDTFAGTNSTYWNATNSPTYESAKSYVNEIPWNDSCASELIADYITGSSQTYGLTGFCNSSTASNDGLLDDTGGSGGPSACATGSPAVAGVVGGTCAGWAKPSYQSVFGNPTDGVRDIPDVSLFAANGIWGHFYPYCWSDIANGGTACTGTPDTWAGGGGTSFSSPIMAGIQALVNQNAGARQGNPNVVYYSLAASEYGASGDSACNSTLGNAVGSSCIFYDVTQGDMDVNCTGTNNCYLDSATIGVLSTSNSAYQPAYGTATGWDFATGIGTVNAANLVNNWPNILPATTTAVISSKNPAFQGVAVTFTATVTPTGANAPTGTVTFNDGTTPLGAPVTLTTVGGAQVATFMTSTLGVGAHSITAVYGGDKKNAASTSSTLTQTINANPTTTTLSSSANPTPSGASVTFTATVTGSSTGASPTGTVTFFNGATQLGNPSALNAGVATLATSSLVNTGSDSISAVYSGDTNNQSSTSQTLTETVNAATFTLAASPATQMISSGGTATITVAVTPQGIYNSQISFTATLTPTSSAQVTFSPAMITPGGTATPTTLTIQGATSGVRRAANSGLPLSPGGLKLSALNASFIWTPIGLAGLLLLGRRKKSDWRVARHFLLAAALALIALTMFGCSNSSPTQTYQVKITATAAASGNSGAVTISTTVAFTAR